MNNLISDFTEDETNYLIDCLSIVRVSIKDRENSSSNKNRRNAIIRWRIKKSHRTNKIKKNVKKSIQSYKRLRYKGKFISNPKNKFISITKLSKIDYY